MAEDAKPVRKLPEGMFEKLRLLISDLEDAEKRDKFRAEGGEIELKINANEALWYVAYKTLA